MSRTAADELATFLESQVGDNLRSVAYYDGEEYDVTYVRDDVASEYSPDEVERVFEDIRLEGFTKPHQEGLYHHDSLNCTMRCFDDAVEMHFALNDRRGIAVAFDAEALSAQRTFVGRCLEVLGLD